MENTADHGLARGNEPQRPAVWREIEFGTFAFGGNSILIFKAGSDGDTPPIARIHGPFTGVSASGIAIGPSGQ
jgi:hypothetical protein